jgi:3-oxoacyl-[acyl-carrier-protein] synthase II
VFITGAGVASPIGTGKQRFFAGLRQARSGVRAIRSFDASHFPVRIAGEVPDVDAVNLALSFPEAPALRRDPKALFFVAAAREALAQALPQGKLADAFDPCRVAMSVASGLEIFHTSDLVPHLRSVGFDKASLLRELALHPPNAFLQIPSHLAALCVAREAGILGPSEVNVSACAAGTQALGEAFWLVRDGEVDAVLAGGFDSMVNPLGIGGFSLLGALSESNELMEGASRPFDAGRNGFVLGEGAAAFFLETEASAKARGSRVLAEVKGYGSTMDAFRVSDPDEHQRGTVAAMRAALHDADLRPGDVDYINAHGTGTRKNDPAETRAIREVFGSAPPPVSSTKSQIGHLIGAAGAVEAMALLFAFAEQTLPATINLQRPDLECDLDYVPDRPRPARVRVALSNSFGFGGQNACLILGGPS